MDIIRQTQKNDCLFACLKMILHYYNKDRGYLFMKNKKNSKYSLLDIKEIAKENNMDLEGVEYTDKNLVFENKIKPFIALFNIDNKNHAVVVYKTSKNYIYIIDPNYGKLKITKEDFVNSFSGDALIVKDYKKTKCKEEKIKLFTSMEVWSLFVVQILSGLSFMLGTYFLDKQISFYIIIALFAGFVIFEIISKKFTVHIMKQVDKRILYSYQVDSNYDEYYRHFTNVKSQSLLSEISINSSLVILAFIFVILVMNSWLNLVYYFTGLISAIVSISFKELILTLDSTHILKLESQLNKCKNYEDFISKAEEINTNGYDYGLKAKLIELIGLGMFIFITLLMMGITNNISLTYLLFNVVMTVFIYKSTYTLLEATLPNPNTDSSFAYIIDKMN